MTKAQLKKKQVKRVDLKVAFITEERVVMEEYCFLCGTKENVERYVFKAI